MAIVLTRIDNRLIHGQIIEAWVPYVQANSIVVANDEVARELLKRALMEMAVPSGIRVRIVTLEQTAACLQEMAATERVLLLFAGTPDALRAHRLGVPFAELNLGNLHGGEGKVRVSCTVCLDGDDMDNLRALETDGVRVIAQCLPSDRVLPLERLCQCVVERPN